MKKLVLSLIAVAIVIVGLVGLYTLTQAADYQVKSAKQPTRNLAFLSSNAVYTGSED